MGTRGPHSHEGVPNLPVDWGRVPIPPVDWGPGFPGVAKQGSPKYRDTGAIYRFVSGGIVLLAYILIIHSDCIPQPFIVASDVRIQS